MNRDEEDTKRVRHGGARRAKGVPPKRESKPFRRVLIVEDNDADATLLQLKLSHFRPPIPLMTRAKTLAGALEILSKSTFDVVLADLHLHDANPEEVMQRLPVAAPTAAFIAVSGVTSPEILAVAIEAQIEGVLRKTPGGEHDTLESQVLQAIARKKISLEERTRMLELESRVDQQAAEMNDMQARHDAEIAELKTQIARLEGKAEGRGEGIEMSKGMLASAMAGVAVVAGAIATAIATAIFG
jgi:DNA-binding NarL/FixJ family response regulator